MSFHGQRSIFGQRPATSRSYREQSMLNRWYPNDIAHGYLDCYAPQQRYQYNDSMYMDCYNIPYVREQIHPSYLAPRTSLESNDMSGYYHGRPTSSYSTQSVGHTYYNSGPGISIRRSDSPDSGESAHDTFLDHSPSLYDSSDSHDHYQSISERIPVRTSQVPSHNYKEYTFDEESVEKNYNTDFTVMIRNVPNRYKQTDLESVLNMIIPAGYTVINFPRDEKTKRNLGYCFITVESNPVLLKLIRHMQNQKWPMDNKEKICRICKAFDKKGNCKAFDKKGKKRR